MANDRYTDKQHAEHLARWQKTGEFPDNSVFDPIGHAAGGPLFRKLDRDEESEKSEQAAHETPDHKPAGEEG